MENSQEKSPSMLQALTPIVLLMVLLFLSVTLFGSDSSYGANQIALLLVAAVGIVIGLYNGQKWKDLQQGIVDGIGLSMGAILILLMVGSLIGTWILAGTVPTMIYYGLQILSPAYFYVASTIICAIVSICIGSSWTTAGTIGVSLIVIAESLGLSSAITAGAIISGAYFGDKMSPLSDTTNLAPAIAGTDLFTHIRHMVWTTVPSLMVAMLIFLLLGLNHEQSQTDLNLETTLDLLNQNFNISIWSLLPLVAVFILAFKKVPALATIFIGALLGCLFALILQPKGIDRYVAEGRIVCESNPKLECSVSNYQFDGEKTTFTLAVKNKTTGDTLSETLSLAKGEEKTFALGDVSSRVFVWGDFMGRLKGTWSAMFSGYSVSTDNESFDSLLSRGGMANMINTIWLILCAMTFGAIMEKTGVLHKLVTTIIGRAKSTASLIGSVLLTCFGMNVVAADQYIAIVLPGRMYRAEFKRRGLDSRNLSRTLEDAGTITSPLIPWNTCGAYMAGTLGVATGAYWLFCFFNLVNPFVAFLYALFNFKITKVADKELADEHSI